MRHYLLARQESDALGGPRWVVAYVRLKSPAAVRSHTALNVGENVGTIERSFVLFRNT